MTEQTHTRTASSRPAAASEAIEDYAKAIFTLARRGGAPVATSALAERLDVSPSSVTAMLKRLDELGLASYVPYRGATLTPAGERVALEVIRHHRLIEAFLSEALDMPWDRVHEEAEVLEHYISEDLERLIAERLGNPRFDPHGDPIPTAELRLGADPTTSLAALEPGKSARFARISDSDPEVLRYLARLGITPGVTIRVRRIEPFGGPVMVAVGRRRHALGAELAEKMRVVAEEAG